MISAVARVARPPAALARLDEALHDLAAGGIVPGGVVAVAVAEGLVHEQAFGRRSVEPASEDATTDTIYDVASITKPAITAALLLDARARGLRFEQPVTDLVPEMAPLPGEPRAPTLGELLLHAGGLPAWAPLYAVAPGDLAARATWCARHRQEPGRLAVYGCPGYQVLGLALERAHGAPLKALAERRLLHGREGLWFGGVPRELRARAAPTERGNAFERALGGDDARGYDGFREGVIRGDVHDHNAFTLGGGAGNAGLFATARGLALYTARFLRPDDEVSREDLAELSRDLAPHEEPGGEMRTWGFQLAGSRNAFAGESAGRGAFGHAGFTGTSVLVDPSRGAVTVLLTNRVHPTARERAFHADRRRVHDALTEVAEALHD